MEAQKWLDDNYKLDTTQHFNLYTDGLKIYTTIDSRLQALAEKAVTQHMKKLQEEFHNADEVAAALDQQIVAGYQLFPSNVVAFEQLQSLLPSWDLLAAQAREWMPTVDSAELARTAAEFSSRLSSYPQKLQAIILEMYANPLLSKFQIQQQPPEQPA